MYQLGVDLGTTKTAAAVWDGERARAIQLGNHSAAVPSVVFLKDDGSLLYGDAALRRADGEPHRAAREFKRRVGDSVPLRLAGTPFSAQQLMALMLTWVIGRVTELQGDAPASVVVTHPANWGPYKRETFLSALRGAGIEPAALVPEPTAAAFHFGSERRIATGETVAVYDLGGGTFDAAVLRRGEDGFAILGSPEGIESLGGMDVDEAVLEHVWTAIGGPPEAADPARVAALRRDVVAAKEYLSEDVSADIRVDLGEDRRTVVIHRSELEELIRPLLELTESSLERSFSRAGVCAGDISAVVLVGGSSRIPLVHELLSSRLGRPVVLDSEPQLAVALGAALATALPAAPPVLVVEQSAPVVEQSVPMVEQFAPVEPFAPVVEPSIDPVVRERRNLPRRGLVIAGLVGAAILIGGVGVALGLPGQGGETPSPARVSPTGAGQGALIPSPTSPSPTSSPTATAVKKTTRPTTERTRVSTRRSTGTRTKKPTTQPPTTSPSPSQTFWTTGPGKPTTTPTLSGDGN